VRIDINLNHNLKGEFLLSISSAFQAQLDRLTAFIASQDSTIATLNAQVASLEAAASGESGPAQDAEDTAALSSALDSESVPAAGSAGVSTSLAGVSTSPAGVSTSVAGVSSSVAAVNGATEG
jgi:prophage DNA circulation protein